MTSPADFTASALSSHYAAGRLSPVEVTRAVNDRIAAWDGQLHATYAFDPDEALRQARMSESRWLAKAPLGPLDGVPITLKELIATKGTPKPQGTAAGDMTPQLVDAPAAARLREQGTVLVAKTTVPDYGMLSSGLSSFHPLCRNPWDLTKNPGGSSAGAGAAAAAGYGPLHIGTDIGGSVRLPAAWCGTFGFKPSNGRIPVDPPYIGRCAGPMTRTVTDAALAMTVLALPDERDYMSLPPQEIDWLDLDIDVRGLRIGLQLDGGCGLPLEPETRAAVEAAARLFEQAGAIVEPVAPFLTAEMLDGLDHFWRARFWSDIRKLPDERYRLILPYIRDWVAPAADYDGETVYTGFNQIMRMMEEGRSHNAHDFILSPVAPVLAFDAELASPTNDPARPFEHIAYTLPANMTGKPASSINCGYSQTGLPIGLHIVGRRFADLGVLKLSRWYETARPEQRPWPTF